MNATTRKPVPVRQLAAGPPFIFHPSFLGPEAEQAYGGVPAEAGGQAFLADDATRDCARRMHYAAWRASGAVSGREAARWRRRYYHCRDLVVVGNRKLTFRAVQKWGTPRRLADDMAAECQVVLIKAVAAYNPWLGIRFSTYAFTCLMRALSRLSQRQAGDRLSRCVPLASLLTAEPSCPASAEPPEPRSSRLDEYFRAEHTLLTPREKAVLIRRYRLGSPAQEAGTLHQVGRELGLSKERVRQVQAAALAKLRLALLAEQSAS
jgi:RNA polymerase sigma factor (sigma-70 family)